MTQDDKKEKKSVERQVGEQKVKINDKKKKRKSLPSENWKKN